MLEILEGQGLLHGSVVPLLNDYLGMKKTFSKWVPLLLTMEHKCKRITISNDLLSLFYHNPNYQILRHFVTMNETWIVLVSSVRIFVKEGKGDLSASKVMKIVVWDAYGLIHIDFLQMRSTIASKYAKSLHWFHERKRRSYLSKKKRSSH